MIHSFWLHAQCTNTPHIQWPWLRCEMVVAVKLWFIWHSHADYFYMVHTQQTISARHGSEIRKEVWIFRILLPGFCLAYRANSIELQSQSFGYGGGCGATSSCQHRFRHWPPIWHYFRWLKKWQLDNGLSFYLFRCDKFSPSGCFTIYFRIKCTYDDILLFDDTCVKHRFVVCIYSALIQGSMCILCASTLRL